MKAEISIYLKASILDPQGQAIASSLKALGHNHISDIRVGRLIHLEMESEDQQKNIAQIHQMCQQLLVNEVMESYSLRIIQ
ncbi:MAG: phosphoribosylformylglycinamidine synthase subunit PurS [Pseudomonadota bacterium]